MTLTPASRKYESPGGVYRPLGPDGPRFTGCQGRRRIVLGRPQRKDRDVRDISHVGPRARSRPRARGRDAAPGRSVQAAATSRDQGCLRRFGDRRGGRARVAVRLAESGESKVSRHAWRDRDWSRRRGGGRARLGTLRGRVAAALGIETSCRPPLSPEKFPAEDGPAAVLGPFLGRKLDTALTKGPAAVRRLGLSQNHRKATAVSNTVT